MLQDVTSLSLFKADVSEHYQSWTVDDAQPKLLDLLSHPETFRVALDFSGQEPVVGGWMTVGEYMTLICILYQLTGFTQHHPLIPPELESLNPVTERLWLIKIEQLAEDIKLEVERQLHDYVRTNCVNPRFLYRRK